MFLMPCGWIVWAELSWHSPILQNHCNFHASSFLNQFWKYVTEVSEWVTAQHAPFFFFFFCGRVRVQVLKRSSFTCNCFGGQAGSQQRFYTEAHEWAESTAGMCFCAGEEKSAADPKPLFPTVRFKTSSRQNWHHYSDSNHNSLCPNVSHLNYKDRCDKKIFCGILGF